MPLCTIHLLALHRTTPNPLLPFLSALKSSNISPIVISRVIRWIILPTHLSTEPLLARNISWDIFLIVPSTAPLPPNLQRLVQHHWRITAGVPSRLLQDFERKNRTLLYPEPNHVPSVRGKEAKRTTESSQNLELSADLEDWIQSLPAKESSTAVSMFNLLAFKPNLKPEYLKYGAAFAERVGARHGGNAKIVGNVVGREGVGDEGWDEVALAHYPSIWHFREMLASDDYQEVNWRYRVGSLRDTCILMTSEVGIGVEWGEGGCGAKL